jgi:diacylglycerol O-acyltransferase
MRRLDGVDAYLWYNDTPTNHMHTLKIAVLDTARADPPYSSDRFVRDLDGLMHLLPPFRWRLLPTPFGLHHPVWVEDPDFDINRHVVLHRAPAPGGQREMDMVIGQIAGSPLQRDRPLWELHLVEGLSGGRVAAVTKIHHAMSDGQAAANQLLNVSERSDGTPLPAPDRQWDPDPIPGRWALIGAALADHPPMIRELPGLVRRTWRARRTLRCYWREASVTPTRPWTGPRTFLNTPIDASRTVATTSIPLASAQELRASRSFTLNDVVLGIMAGALRTLLLERGGPTDRALVANIPAATGRRVDRLFGNSVGLLFADLPVHLPHPVDRLKVIHESTFAARRAAELAGIELLDDWLQYVPPSLFTRFSRHHATSKITARRPPMMNLVASNVRGPGREVRVSGVPLVDLFSVGPLNIGVGLNITVWSYSGKLNFTVLSSRPQLPDPHVVTDALQAAFVELGASLGVRAEQDRRAP